MPHLKAKVFGLDFSFIISKVPESEKEGQVIILIIYTNYQTFRLRRSRSGRSGIALQIQERGAVSHSIPWEEA